ncbi:siderophore-interacting protein [Streptomyces sp. NPDC005438]|uniref:siderophore-interacting protein n=1 Tax=Streptomyces sp. NPDC005438 TaxID=3156880 RepID=UPI0033B33938
MSNQSGALPFQFFSLRVLRTRRLTPSMLRVTLGGEDLKAFVSGGRDQRFKLFLPHPGQEEPVVPSESGPDWFLRWREMDPTTRAVMRSYTVRHQRRTPRQELDVDFALHGDEGPASRWAQRAEAGDRVTLLGPVEEDNGGVDFRPPEGTDLVLLTGDETALPAIAAALEWLPADTRVRAWIQVPRADDIQDLTTAADAEITWVVADAQPPGRDGLLEALRGADIPADATPYAWIAGEAGSVRAQRRHLVNERGVDRRAITFTGYWRRGATEEQLVEEAVSTAKQG